MSCLVATLRPMARLSVSKPDPVVMEEVPMPTEKAIAISNPGKRVPLEQLLRGLEAEMTVAMTFSLVMEDRLPPGLPAAVVVATIMGVTVSNLEDMEPLLEVPPHGSDNKMLPLHLHPVDRTMGMVDILAATAALRGVTEANRAWALLPASGVAQVDWVLLPGLLPCTRDMVPMDRMGRRLHHPEKLLRHR